jgi:hypothetical protein
MTSWAAPFTTAAPEAANDSLTNVTTRAVPAHTTPESIPTLIASFPKQESANDIWYDPTAQCESDAKLFLSELIRALRPHAKDIIGREPIKAFTKKNGWVFGMPHFWDTLGSSMRSCFHFGSSDVIRNSRVHTLPTCSLDVDSRRFIAEECWTAFLLGTQSQDAKRVSEILLLKRRLTATYLERSEEAIIGILSSDHPDQEISHYLAAFIVAAERGIEFRITRFP